MSLYCRTIRYSLIRIYTVIKLLAIEIARKHITHLGDTRGATHHHDLIDLLLAHLGILEQRVQRRNTTLEEGLAKRLKLSTRQSDVKVVAFCKTIKLNRRLRG